MAVDDVHKKLNWTNSTPKKRRPRESRRSKRSLSGVFDLRLEIVEPD